MKAARRDAKRTAARDRRQQLLEGDATSLVTKVERAQLYERIWGMLKNIPRLSRRAKEAKAHEIVTAQIAQLEAQRVEEKRLVKPADGGLVIRAGRLVVTPDDVRAEARRNA